MSLEPLFYVVALLSVFVHGMGKAGFGMGLPILAIPMMSLFVSPIQALSILVTVGNARALVVLQVPRPVVLLLASNPTERAESGYKPSVAPCVRMSSQDIVVSNFIVE